VGALIQWQDPSGWLEAVVISCRLLNHYLRIAEKKFGTVESVQRSFTIPEGWSLQQMAAIQRFFQLQYGGNKLTATSTRVTCWRTYSSWALYPWYIIQPNRRSGYAPDCGTTNAEPLKLVALPVYQQHRATEFNLREWVTSCHIEKKRQLFKWWSRIAGVHFRLRHV